MDKEILKQALDMRIPQITDKESAYKKLQEHVSEGNLTQEEGQAYVDLLFPIEYDEDGNALNEQRILETANYMSPEEEVKELEGVVADLTQLLVDKGVIY